VERMCGQHLSAALDQPTSPNGTTKQRGKSKTAGTDTAAYEINRSRR